MKRILVVTGARSEFGLLAPVVTALMDRADVVTTLAVTGVHLLADYGRTIEEVRAAGYRIHHEIPMYESGPLEDGLLPAALARATSGVAEALAKDEAEGVLVLGDRAEALAAALASYAAGRVVVHIHGGDRTDSGHTDEAFRHAITRFAHVHLAATEESAARLRATGEEEWRVHRVGSPGLDTVMAQLSPAVTPTESELAARFDLDPARPLALFLFHPDRLEQQRAGALATQVLDALLAENCSVVAVYPNSDPGSEAIVAAIDAARARAPERIAVRTSLPRLQFLEVLAGARLMVGNSSAGLIEAPCVGLPVVNVGKRNRHREHGANVLFVDADAAGLRAALRQAAEDPRFRARCQAAGSPYGDGQSAVRIARIVAETEVDARLLGKRITV